MQSEQLWGRTGDLATVAELLASARRGEGGALVLRGEAGIGKTALLRHVTARESELTVLSGTGVEPESALPFSGLHLLLRRVEHRLDELAGEHAATLRQALGLGRPDDPPADRHRVTLATLALVTALAAERPLLVAVDDAHWLDRASLDVLVFVARRLGTVRAALLLTARDGHAPALSLPGVADHRLPTLGDDDAHAVLAAHAGDLPGHVRRQVVAEAQGNPLALHELSAARRQGHPAATGPVQSTLRLSLADRVAALPHATRLLVTVAAADGTGDAATVLAAAATLGAGPADLTAAERAELLEFQDTRLEFRHPLVRAAAYGAASVTERLTVHRALAAALTAPEDADRRAWHLASATTGRDADVAAALESTAEHARARGGSVAVASAYERAAALSTTACERTRRLVAAARAAADAGQPDRALDLVRQAERYCPTPAAGAWTAMIHAVIADDQDRPGESYRVLTAAAHAVAADDPELAGGLVFWAAHSAWTANEPALVEQAAQLARRWELPTASSAWRLVRAGGGTATARRSALRELLTDADTLFGGCSDRPLALRGRTTVAEWHLLAGDHLQARTVADDVVRAARAECAAGVLAPALAVLADAELGLGLHAQARATATEGLRLAEESSQTRAVSALSGVLARLAALAGDTEAVSAHAPHADVGDATHALASLDLGHGRHDAAVQRLVTVSADTPRDAADLAEAVARAHHTGADASWWHDVRERAERAVAGLDPAGAVALRGLALLAEARSAEEADTLFTRALDAHDAEPRQVFERARTELAYGEWLRRRRRATEARTHLRAAVTGFESLGERPWSARARTELRASGESLVSAVPRAADVEARLTPQERRIVGLAATGLSNRDIGTRLFLSPRTVGYHLYKAYPKLGVSSRGELAGLGLAG
ncbi:helix-turn-helix transcriptional regulator [Saccharomonospora piscinae]|uniref:helix-turn-helix transcriptional regulator n=1 Tax=Saccharomonospora piscinae TaxID=687388 RepID=UPI0004BB078F|nr:LuxR family transcriptional regulator [Saccharomonospora piscinae]